jgi:hypothetical protein
MSRTTRTRAAAVAIAGLLAAVTVLLVAPAPPSAAQAANSNNYALTAQGDGLYFELYDESLPATTSVLASPYSAQALLNSTGTSTAFAGFPNPGPVIGPLPQTVNGLGGSNFPPLPPLPGYIQSSHPTSPSVKQTQGPYVLETESAENSSRAVAGFGMSAAGDNTQQISSRASVTANEDGSVTAKASAGATGFKLGPLELLDFTSSVTMVEQASAEPEITSTTNIGTITVLGFKLGIDQDGFKVLGANIPHPTKEILDSVSALLSANNISISYIPAVTTLRRDSDVIESYTSGHLRFETVQDIPSQGPVTVILTTGRVTVSATNLENAAASGGLDTGGGMVDTSAPPIDTSASVEVPPLDLGSSMDLPALATPSLPTTPSGAAAPDGTQTLGSVDPGLVLGRAALSVPLESKSPQAIYLLLVLCAIAAFAGPQLIRIVAVQLRFSPRLDE